MPRPSGACSRVRRDGYVVARGSIEAVSTGVAVPVRDRTGDVIAALSVVLPRDAPTEQAIAALLQASRGIRSDLSEY
jgi:DNA-binding IclR family transcriptional regulator